MEPMTEPRCRAATMTVPLGSVAALSSAAVEARPETTAARAVAW
jgi:hypothetical protein